MPKILFDQEGEAIGGSEDLEIVQQQTIVETRDDSEDSDDEAPEAISTSKAKATVLQTQKIQNESLARSAAKDKDRRRQHEKWLKEQKQGSKREQKQTRKPVEAVEEEDEEEDEEADEEADEEEDEEADEEADEEEDESEDNERLLPDELLAQAAQETELAKADTHLRAEDFERLAAESEDTKQQEEQRKRKRKTEAGVRQVGEYTVKVLNKRPRAPAVDQDLKGLKDSQQIHRKGLPRKAAILQRSEALVGQAALQFRRR